LLPQAHWFHPSGRNLPDDFGSIWEVFSRSKPLRCSLDARMAAGTVEKTAKARYFKEVA
jgi:hypothetical protein